MSEAEWIDYWNVNAKPLVEQALRMTEETVLGIRDDERVSISKAEFNHIIQSMRVMVEIISDIGSERARLAEGGSSPEPAREQPSVDDDTWADIEPRVQNAVATTRMVINKHGEVVPMGRNTLLHMIGSLETMMLIIKNLRRDRDRLEKRSDMLEFMLNNERRHGNGDSSRDDS